MGIPAEIEDPSDWLNTSLTSFSPLDNALRCQVCKDFYSTPMLTSCAHTFCSKCIRTCLSMDGKCPACRSADQASKLRNNFAVEEAVGAFMDARPVAYRIALKDKMEEQEKADEESRRAGKRRRISREEGETGGEGSRRQTRSMRSRGGPAATPATTTAMQIDGAVEVMDSDDDDDNGDEDFRLDDGLVACPICSTRMKEQQVDPHIESECDGTKKKDKVRSRGRASAAAATNASSSSSINPLQRRSQHQQSNNKPQERLAELNYSLLKENALRKKLAELGLPSTGTKPLLKERHTEWINLWNANCDSRNPKSKQQLLGELRKWEQAQGGQFKGGDHQQQQVDGGGSVDVMKKDFDAAGWQSSNKDDFARLIEQAKRKRGQQSSLPEQVNGDDDNDGKKKSNDSNVNDDDNEKDKRVSHPYENNPEAISSIREKVRAANAESTAFANQQLSPLSSQQQQQQSSGSSGAKITNRSGIHQAQQQQQQQQQQQPSQEAIPPSLEKNSSLGEHFALPADRQMDMFRLPEDPVSENDEMAGGGGGGAVH